MKRLYPYLLVLLTGCLLLPLPLLGDFHFELAMLAAILGAFWGGWRASVERRTPDLTLFFRFSFYVLLFSIPVFLKSWVEGCLSLHGLGFWLLLPFPSVLFGISSGRLVRKLFVPLPRVSTILLLLIFALGTFLIQFFTLPQVYFFNHVWGSWPGPIYDQTVEVTLPLVYFRLVTLFWSLLFWNIPNWKSTRTSKILVSSSALIIITVFFFRPELGLTSPRSYLQSELSTTIETKHFALYFDPEHYTREEMDYWAERHEFHFDQVRKVLAINWPDNRKIESYLYAHAWQKKTLVGAKFTSYVPVWLEQDQLHIAKEHLEGVLKHEIVHVLAKQFGNRVFNASWSIGLIEGIAEAIAKDASPVSTLDQIIAAESPLPTAREMSSALSLTGFYASASSISYTTAGSFVSYLIDQYPIEYLKSAYPGADIETFYPVSFDSLVAGWKQQLPISEVDSLDQQVSTMVFSQQSLFQISCPRASNPLLEQWDEIRLLEAKNDSAAALTMVNRLYEDYSNLAFIKQKWLNYQIRLGDPLTVVGAVAPDDSSFGFQLMKSDALFLAGSHTEAEALLAQLRKEKSSETDQNTEFSFEVRRDSLTWGIFVRARYLSDLPDPDTFDTMPAPLKWLLINRSLHLNEKETFISYIQRIQPADLTATWFDQQLSVIDRLVFLNSFSLAEQWLEALQKTTQRLRYKERLSEQREWLEFAQQY